MPLPFLPLTASFVGLMSALAVRNVAARTLATRVPRADERAGFFSLLTAAQHIAAAIAATASAGLLSTTTQGGLIGMNRLGLITIGLSLIVPLSVGRINRALDLRQRR